MSWTFLSCVLIVLAWLGLSFLWGRSFLTMIHAERDIASSIVFGYFSLQLLYQVFYLPFFLTRGSYRVVSYCWLVTVALCSALLLYYLRRHPSERRDRADWRAKVGLCAAAVLVLGLACFVALRAPLYGSDTLGYISEMNRCLNTDTLWINSGSVYFHSGMASMLQLFTVSALLTGIRPYYISLFTVRILGIVLSSLVVYHTGVILFRKACTKVCWPAITLAVLVPYLLMLWGSMYTAEFFYWRINEAKGYCQFVLLPMGFSIFLEMFKKTAQRKTLWKEQLLVGLAAVPVSASSLTPYVFLLTMGTFSLLAHDKYNQGWVTVGRSVVCALPNLLYLVVYILVEKSIIVF